jgi:hypothetical protein
MIKCFWYKGFINLQVLIRQVLRTGKTQMIMTQGSLENLVNKIFFIHKKSKAEG